MLGNRLKILGDYFFNIGKEIFPSTMVIELTNHCNLRCPMCPHQKMKRGKGFMPESLYRRIIDQAAGRVEVIALHFLGESLIHPRCPEFVAYAANKGITTYLSTNGTLLDTEKARALFAAGLAYLLIDFDGDGKESYEEIRLNANYEKVLHNIKTAVAVQREIRERSGVKTVITLQTIIFPGQARNLRRRFTSDELKYVQIREKPFSDTFNSDEKIIGHRRGCFIPWYQMTIAWDGTVPLCCVDYDCRVPVGNMNTSSIKEIWNNPGAGGVRRLREKHRRIDYQDIPMCNSCGVPNTGYFNPFFVLLSLLAGFRFTRFAMAYGEKFLALLRKR